MKKRARRKKEKRRKKEERKEGAVLSLVVPHAAPRVAGGFN